MTEPRLTPDDLYAAVQDISVGPLSSLSPEELDRAQRTPIPRDHGKEKLTKVPNRAMRRHPRARG